MGRIEIIQLHSDDRLARRAAAGDERAFAAIFDRYHQDLYRFCLAIVGSAADAQDALQNTMVKVLRALPGEERRIELKPWLYRIAHNEAVELLRRRRPTERLDPELAARAGSLAEDAEARGRLRRLLADLEQLPDRQRSALVMRELGGLDFEEIGAALGASAATARQALYEARQSLRQIDEGREMSCEVVTRALSDADGRVTRRRDIRAHLRACPDCRRFREEIEGRRGDLGALAPLPALAATGLLQGLLGGAAAGSGAAGAGAGAGLAGAAAGGAAKSVGAGAAIKSAAAVAAVAAVGVGAADRSGVVDVTPWGGGSQAQKESQDRAEPGGVPPGSGAPASGGPEGSRGAASAESRGGGEQGATAGNDLTPQQAVADAGSGAKGGRQSAPGADGIRAQGAGKDKQHPAAASHGQQTAAEHKAAGQGGGRTGGGAGKGQSAEQPKPAKPTRPSKPVSPQPDKPAKPGQSGGGAVELPPKAPSDPGAAAPPAQPSPAPQADGKASPPVEPGRDP